MNLRTLALGLGLVACLGTPTMAQDPAISTDGCPSSEPGVDSTIHAVERASTCRRAFQIMEQCSMAGGSDGPIGNAVREKCEAGFLPRLSRSQRQRYERAQNRCIDSYANQAGSLYGSRIAFCRVRRALEQATRYERGR